MKKLNKKGFTLIELIVVIAILAILAAILIPSVTGYITKATDAKNLANCRSYFAQVSLQVMIDEDPTPASSATAVVNDLIVEYSFSDDDNVVTAFTCKPQSGSSATLTMK
jgi:type IV pilus assembly protein PilA